MKTALGRAASAKRNPAARHFARDYRVSIRHAAHEFTAFFVQAVHSVGGNDGLHSHIEFQLEIDANALGGDQRFFTDALDLDAIGAHVNFVDFVQERQSHITPESGSFARRNRCMPGRPRGSICVKAIEKNNDDGNYDNRNDDTK